MKNVLVSACLMGAQCRYDGRCVFSEDIAKRLMNACNPVPFCPEIYGGLPTPREPSEKVNGRVISKTGADVTNAYLRGAEECLKMCLRMGCEYALLKSKSPSCGKGIVYDGTFSGTLVEGNGVTAELLMKNGIQVFSSDDIELFFAAIAKNSV